MSDREKKLSGTPLHSQSVSDATFAEPRGVPFLAVRGGAALVRDAISTIPPDVPSPDGGASNDSSEWRNWNSSAKRGAIVILEGDGWELMSRLGILLVAKQVKCLSIYLPLFYFMIYFKISIFFSLEYQEA